MATVKHITAREILNSKGSPTIETIVVLDDETTGVASCPSGTSTGAYEAVELRDNDSSHFAGLGVIKAITNIEKIIAPKLISIEPYDQEAVDKTMIDLDGTENKAHLGANAILSVSMAIAKAAANSSRKPLYQYLHEKYNQEKLKIPTPIFNVMNGGQHGSGSLDFQEFILVPSKAKSYTESLYLGFTIYQALKKLLKQNNYSTLIGDEGGFEPHLNSNYNALDFLVQAIDASGVVCVEEVFLGLDVAANSFFKNNLYNIKDKKKPLSSEEIISYYQDLVKGFRITYLEDFLSEDDWSGWSRATRLLRNETLLVGDDLTTTNPKRLQTAIDKKAITAIIIKPNQIGTVTETMEVAQMAQNAGIK